MPTPYRTVERAPVPEFVASGAWRQYVRPGHTLVPVPVPSPTETAALGWQIDAGLGFAFPGGYFNGPWGPDRVGIYGPEPRPTSDLLAKVRETGRVPAIDERQRRDFRSDLAFWNADAVVLTPQDDAGPLRAAVTRLAGREPVRSADAWVWDVRGALP